MANENESAGEREERAEHEARAAAWVVLRTVAGLPHREWLSFEVGRAEPIVFEVRPSPGQELRIHLAMDPAMPIDARTSVFTAEANSSPLFRLVTAADGRASISTRVFWATPHFVVIEPGALGNREGRFLVDISAGASLTFPVFSRDARAIKSFWGDRRDRGRRKHEGVDIFAPRGTPVVAASNGYIAGAGWDDLGGKVVWLRDEHQRRYYYYAHLDELNAAHGDRVRVGDVLGWVGNTGNARTTPPHLHFGVYSPRAMDPMPFVNDLWRAPTPVVAPVPLIGRTVVVAPRKTPLLLGPDVRAEVLRELPRDTELDLLGASGRFFRARTLDGSVGYVGHRAVRAPAGRS